MRCGPAWIARDPWLGSRPCGQAPVLSRKAAWAGERGARLARGLPAGKCLSPMEEKPGRGSAPGLGGTPTFGGREGSGRESAPCGRVGAIAGPACELGVKDRDRREEHRGALPLTPDGGVSPRSPGPMPPSWHRVGSRALVTAVGAQLWLPAGAAMPVDTVPAAGTSRWPAGALGGRADLWGTGPAAHGGWAAEWVAGGESSVRSQAGAEAGSRRRRGFFLLFLNCG